MTIVFRSVFFLTVIAALTVAVFGQVATQPAQPQPTPPLARNPKISLPDFETAKAETLASGGEKAELVYAARIDALQRGTYDCVIVIYQKPAKAGKDWFAVVLREGQKFPLVLDKQDKLGRALKSGDKFLRIGLKHEEGKSPLLRLIASTVDKEKGDQQRNVDFQFNGTEFALTSQSMTPLPK